MDIMLIDTGSKAFWLGTLFFLIGIDAILMIIVGLLHIEKSRYHDFATACDGIILLVISAGWWFGS
jgi:hypothetical protein